MTENNQNNQISLTPQKRKKQQKIGLIITGLIFMVIVFAVSFSEMGGKIEKQENKKEEDYTITIADPAKNAKTEDRWLVNAQEKMDIHSAKINETLEENLKLKELLENL